MSAESLVYSTLSENTDLISLVSGRVFPDMAPEGSAMPFVTYQRVGGDALNFIDRTSPSMSQTRMQVNVWAASRAVAIQVAEAVETAMRANPALNTVVLESHQALFEFDLRMYGTRQDFSVFV